MVDVPLPLAGLGVAIAAAVGFVAGRMTGGRTAVEPEAGAGPVIEPGAAGELLDAALARLAGERFAFVVRVDAVETWKRTHGRAALDQFARRLAVDVRSALPDAVDVRTGEAEVTGVCEGVPAAAAAIMAKLRRRRFRLPSGAETLVTCSLGAAPAEAGLSMEELRNRANGAVRDAQGGGRWQMYVSDAAGSRPLNPPSGA